MKNIFRFMISGIVSSILFLLPIDVLAYEQSPILWVQVPQWDDDWSECAVDIPDSSCHWYVPAPDSTFGKGFSWENSPWFDANGLYDVPATSVKTAVEKLQQKD